MKKIFVPIIVIILAAGAWWYWGGENADRGGETIKIGAVLPLTGIAASYGEHQRNAIELAVEEINKRGGIAGKPVEIIFEDDKTESAQSVSATTKLIDVNGISVVIGGVWDFLANAVVPVINSKKKVLITPSAPPDTLEVSSPYFFATFAPISAYQPVFEQYLNQYASARVVTVVVNNFWGKAHADAFRTAIRDTGNTLVKEIVLPQFDNNDIQRELTLIRSIDTDVILLAINLNDSLIFAQKRRVLGVDAPILAHANFASNFFSGKIEGTFMNGITIFKPAPPSNDFTEQYRATYGIDPIVEADSAYDAVFVIKQAIENVEGRTDADSIVEGLHMIRGYQGVSGTLDFDQFNYPHRKSPILQEFRNGAFLTLEP